MFSRYRANIAEFRVKSLRLNSMFIAVLGFIFFMYSASRIFVKISIAGQYSFDAISGPLGEDLIGLILGLTLALILYWFSWIAEWKNILAIEKIKNQS